jgi:hypothetical protein
MKNFLLSHPTTGPAVLEAVGILVPVLIQLYLTRQERLNPQAQPKHSLKIGKSLRSKQQLAQSPKENFQETLNLLLKSFYNHKYPGDNSFGDSSKRESQTGLHGTDQTED